MPDDTRPDLATFDRALAEHEIREYAEQLGYDFAALTDGVLALAPRDTPPAAVLALVGPDEIDDDGQMWFGDYEIRVDTTGSGPAEIHYRGEPVDVNTLELHARALISAIAAARAAD